MPRGILIRFLIIASLLIVGVVIYFLLPSSPPTIIFFGDSITDLAVGKDGFITLLHDSLSLQRDDLKLISKGVSGDRVPDLMKRVHRDVLLQQPSCVVLYIGTNDVWHSIDGRGTPRDEFESGLAEIVSVLRASSVEVILCTPAVIGEKTDGSNPFDTLLEEYAGIIRQVAERHGVSLCDLRSAFLSHLKAINPQQRPSGILTRDGVHLTAAGNLLVAGELAKYLKPRYTPLAK